MKTRIEIEHLLEHELIEHLQGLDPNTAPVWGTMNVWQMIEHLAWPFKTSNGTIQMPQTTPDDKLERVRAIGLFNDRPMQHHFNNPIYTEAYKKIRNTSIEAAIEELKSDIQLFKSYFTSQPSGSTLMHNIFGPLNYDEWLQFHHKHVKHHLEQFGIRIN